MKMNYWKIRPGLTLFFVLMAMVALQAQSSITGVVTSSDDGGLLPGVNIIIKGTTGGTTTNIDGEFSIKANPEDILVFSYIGYLSEEIQVGSQNVIDVSLILDIQSLNEVVIVGYGTQKKSDVTGSVASIDKDVLESRPRASLENLLQGTMAGLTINQDASNAEGSSNSMLIRGSNSISASNEPLIILDGVPYAGNLSELNPRDIGSIEVLKDASSAAIYGARGSNGVILITTVKGKEGELKVNYDGFYSWNKVINIPDMMDGKTFYETKVERGLATTAIEDEGYDSGRNTDWIDLATQTGSNQQHNLSFSGGTAKTNYFISMAYVDNKGIAVGDKFNRYTFRLNLGHKLGNWITFNTNTQYGYYDRSGNNASFSRAFTMNPLGIPYNEDGSIRLETWEDGVYAENPLTPLLNSNNNITRRFTTNNSLLFEIPGVEGLSYKLNTGYDYRSSLNQTYRGRNTLTGARVNGSLSVDNGHDEDWLVENIINYKRDFGVHSLFFTGLYSAQSEWAEDHDIDAQGFPNDVMTYYQASKASLVEPSSSYSLRTHISQMLRVNYGFDSRYLLTLTARRDGFSAFGEDSKFGIFPSVALGWNIANEQFLANSEQLGALKLRVSYGKNGNEAVSAYSTLPRLSSIDYVDGDDNTLFGFYPSRLGDPSLGWETTTSFNAGLDFGYFGNRLTGSIDAYWSNTTDLLLERAISSVNGTTYITQNIGETKNNGIELQLSSINIDNNDFKWTTNLNVSHYNSKIVHVGLTDDNGNYIDDVGNKWFIGEPVVVNYGYVFDGIYQEDEEGTPRGDVSAGDIRYFDTTGDSLISADDRQVIGRRIPDVVLGLTNTFSYKNWRFSFFLYGVTGITKANDLLGTNDLDMRQNRYNVEFWTEENGSNEYPRNDKSSIVNEFSMPFYRNADFLRLQDISLGYSLPQSVLDKMRLQNFEVYGNITNLATWTSWEGLDPQFENQDAVPQQATYLLGVKLGF
ncbi:TonB-dependent receptor [Flammeovirgaceae bacterium SG7u.111]|nr:TonB-dependent receptor [Flammeovirgaceae bacterium SG7u.132]WPO34926.1 TonB-dependent receptor [Flammeovirgaceae bacterium SG7u.111]